MTVCARQRKFLLKFARDRRRYLHWVFEAKKRFDLSVLNYMVTSNHIHLLVKDTGANIIAQSMQLIAGAAPRTNTTSEKDGRERSGKTVTMPRLLRPANTCITVWSTLT